MPKEVAGRPKSRLAHNTAARYGLKTLVVTQAATGSCRSAVKPIPPPAQARIRASWRVLASLSARRPPSHAPKGQVVVALPDAVELVRYLQSLDRTGPAVATPAVPASRP